MQTWKGSLILRCGQVFFGRPRVVSHKLSRYFQLPHDVGFVARFSAAGSGLLPLDGRPSAQAAPESISDARPDGRAEVSTPLPNHPSHILPKVDGNDIGRGSTSSWVFADAEKFLLEARDENGVLPLEGARQLLASSGSGDDLESMQSFIETVLEVDQKDPRKRVAAFILQVLTLFWRSLDKAYAQKAPKSQQQAKDRATAALVMRIDKGLRKKLADPALSGRMVLLLARCHAEPVQLMDMLLNLSQQPTDLVDSAGRVVLEILPDGEAAGSKPPVRTEAKPRHRRILDVDVRCELDAQLAQVRVPPSNRTVIMSSLPTGTTEELLREALAGCGQVRHVEVIEVFSPLLRVFAPREVEVPDSTGTTDPTTQSEGCYAIVEFETETGYKSATRRAVRLFGVLLRVRMPKGKHKKLSPTGWPVFPQVARHKRSIVLTNLPWSLRPRDILMECTQQLQRFTANSKCVLKATNCRSFRATKSSHIESLGVHAEEGQVVVHEQPVRTGPIPRQYWNDGAVVLRFKSFDQANIARQVLGSIHFGDRQMYCNFATQRPYFCDEDAAGNALEQPCFVDFPVQRRRHDLACNHEIDPIVEYGIPADEFDDFDFSRMHVQPP